MIYFFREFLCFSLCLLIGMRVYEILWGPASEGFDEDLSEIKYAVMQLTRGLIEANRKHENLKAEISRVSSALPSVAAAAGRAEDALQANTYWKNRQTVAVQDYDRQVVDFALESAGGRVLETGDTVQHVLYESPVGYALHTLASWMCRGYECMSARAMLQPGTLPGQCWAFRGARGDAVIRLLGTIYVSGVSLEHIPATISPTKDIASAPRIFQLEGLEVRGDPHPHDFGSFEYDKNGPPIQYFDVQHHPHHKGYNLVRLRILSNWGHPVYTCVYRVRVHGDLVPGQVPHTTENDEIEV